MKCFQVAVAFSCCFTSFFLSHSVFAVDQEDPCVGPHIRIIEAMPFRFDQGKSFQYRYFFRKPRDQSQPTVFFIPGGPGQGVMHLPSLLSRYPTSFGVILIDPRHVGCNAMPGDFDSRNLSNEFHASDLVDVAIHAGVLNKLIIHGVSYGTVPATIFSAMLAKAGRAPLATVLEGTIRDMGRPFPPERDTAIATGVELFSRLLKVEDAKRWGEAERIAAAAAALGIAPEELERLLGQAYRSAIHIGESRYQERIASSFDKVLSKTASDSDLEFLRTIAGQLDRGRPQPRIKRETKFTFYDAVMCDLIESYSPDGICGKAWAGSYSYDPKNYKIRSSIYYFHGELDIVVPIQQGLYHFESQRDSSFPKYFIQFPRLGHNPLGFQIGVEWGCTDAVWRAIGEQADPALALSTCGKDFSFRKN